ncbi:MAG: PepSY-like domain-containing protein [Bacteroidota bacterium]
MRYLLFASLLLVLLNSCDKEEPLTDVALVEAIAGSAGKVAVAPADLPPALLEEVFDNYFETYVESVSRVDDKGYELLLGNEDVLYSRLDGSLLREGSIEGRPYVAGPCGAGQRVRPDELPAAILEHIETQLPLVTLQRAKRVGMQYLIQVNRQRILIYDLEGTFLGIQFIFYHCVGWGAFLGIDRLPPIVSDFIMTRYPDSAIKVARKMRNGNIVVGIRLGLDMERRIFVFDEQGQFLFERG